MLICQLDHIKNVFCYVQVQSIGTPESIAVDWISKNLYWIESSVRTKSIKVATVEGKHVRTLLQLEADCKPQNIVLDPRSRYVLFVFVFHVKYF